MRTTRLLAAALALAAGACTSSTAPGVTLALRQPSAIAVFRGYTIDDPLTVRPYLVVANASRNDLTVIDAADDTAVQSPIQLRALSIPVADRPALLAAASLGDDDPAVRGDERPDLLVAVSAGSSELQLVRTWTTENDVEDGATVDLGDDVLALAVLPSPAGTARVAAALAGRKLAVVEYSRAPSGDAIVPGAPVVHGLGFEPAALATIPGDEGRVYAASLEPIGGVFGVGAIDVATPAEPWPVTALDARGPTRLVAGARLRERSDTSSAANETAFAGADPVARLYAVLDESGCGLDRRIECGIVTLDPAKVPAAGDDHVLDDWSGRMPYRAPVSVPGRPLALAVAPPPAVAPPGASLYQGDYMRLLAGPSEQATTAVAAVASDDGRVYFLDLGRFKLATVASTLSAVNASVTEPALPAGGSRLWIQVPGTATFAADVQEAATHVTVTPGFTRDSGWTITFQGILPSLASRIAEVGLEPDGTTLWLAMQSGDGPAGPGRAVNEVVRLFHPALGVAANDLVVLRAADVPAPPAPLAPCVGTRPPGADETTPALFELTIGALLAPGPDRPGGAVTLLPPDPDAQPEWAACYAALAAAVPAGGILPRLVATIRGDGLVLTGGTVGYAGRPAAGQPFALEYPRPGSGEDEDVLAASCPLADWDGSFPVPPELLTCSVAGTCNDRAKCEELVLVRKARRVHHNFEDCSFTPEVTGCAERWPGITFPRYTNADGELPVPALAFQVGEQGGPVVRDAALGIATGGVPIPVVAQAEGSTSQANGLIAFDRSTENGETGATAGYRFLVSYPADLVFDVSPSVNPLSTAVIR